MDVKIRDIVSMKGTPLSCSCSCRTLRVTIGNHQYLFDDNGGPDDVRITVITKK